MEKHYRLNSCKDIKMFHLLIADATSLTEAGYVGDDVESVLLKTIASC